MSVQQIRSVAVGSWHCGCIRATVGQREPRAKIFHRYMDDILRSMKRDDVDGILARVNALHPNLEFTIETEDGGSIPFLDMLITRSDQRLHSDWYTKPTDTGLCLSYHACAPTRFKRNTVEGMVHRIHHASSTWAAFHRGLEKAKVIWERNQYPPAFYNPLVRKVIAKIINERPDQAEQARSRPIVSEKRVKSCLILQYRGKVSDKMSRKVKGISQDINIVFTTCKMKSALPSLKAKVSKDYCSRVVYKITCTSCSACYVGQTSRHLKTRVTEHLKDSAPVGSHLLSCAGNQPEISILHKSPGLSKLLTLEALYIQSLNPTINSREEYVQRPLMVKL